MKIVLSKESKNENIVSEKFKTKITLVLALFMIASFAFGQKGDYSKYKGYVDFGNLEEFEAGDEATEVLIEEHLLRMVSKMAGKEEPELGGVLDGLKLIKVNTFEVSEENFNKLSKVVKKIDKKLMNGGWDRIVRTRSKDEVTNVFILTSNEEKIDGLVVTSIEKGGEAAFVNIVGNIDLETIGELGDKFDIPSIGDISGVKEKEEKSEKSETEVNSEKK